MFYDAGSDIPQIIGSKLHCIWSYLIWFDTAGGGFYKRISIFDGIIVHREDVGEVLQSDASNPKYTYMYGEQRLPRRYILFAYTIL